MNIKNTWGVQSIRATMDTDRDGVPDFKDCKPFDPKKHLTDEEEEEMNKDIYDWLEEGPYG